MNLTPQRWVSFSATKASFCCEEKLTYNARHHLRYTKAARGSTFACFDYDDADPEDGDLVWQDFHRLTLSGHRRGVRESITGVSSHPRLVGYPLNALYRLTQEAIYGTQARAGGGTEWTNNRTCGTTYDFSLGYTETNASPNGYYDPVGNRRYRWSSLAGVQTRTYAAYDANDRLGSTGTNVVRMSFDANGNTLQSDLDADGAWDQPTADVYDAENRLIRATRGAGTIDIVYDADGNRVKKTVGSTTTCFLVDDLNPTGYAQVIEERALDPSSTGLVGRWRMDEGSGTTAADDAGANHTATLLNGTTWGAGIAGRALHFDGLNDFARVDDAADLRLGANMTIAFWVKKDSEAAGWVRLVGKGSDEEGLYKRNYGVWDWPGDTKDIHFQTYGPSNGYIDLRSTVGLEVGVWYHVACTYDGATARIYVNGAPAGQLTASIVPYTNSAPLLFGCMPGSYLPGSLDEIRIYNRALAAGEIANLAQAPVQFVYGLDLISQTRNGTTSYYGYDGHGSVRYLTDGTPGSATFGQVTDTYTYDAFGVQIGGWSLNPQQPTLNSYRYAGEYSDPDLGMYYLRARYYHPDLGRFWTMDTFEGNQSDPMSLHKYVAFHNDPANKVDPSGHMTMVELKTTVALWGTMTLAYVSRVGPRVQAAFSQGSKYAGHVFNEIGAYAQNQASQVLRLIQTSASRFEIKENVKMGSKVIDFVVSYGQRVAQIEVKYGLPHGTGPALTRLVAQVEAASKHGQGQIVLWTLRAPSTEQIRLVTKELGSNANKVQFVHGVEGLFQWAGFYFGL